MSEKNVALARGLFDGINNATAIMRDAEDRNRRQLREDTQFNQQQTAYQQGQADRTHALKRRDINEIRSDAEYDRAETDRLRIQESQQALNDFMVRGNLESANAFLDKYSPENMKPTIVQNADGSFSSVGKDQTGQEVSKKLERDDIGKLLMRMGKQDVFGEFQKRLDEEKAGKAKAGDQAFELKKIEAKGIEDRKTEMTKAGVKGKDGKVPDYSKEHAKLAKEYNGQTYQNGMWSFGEGKNMASAMHATLADAIHEAKGYSDSNKSHYEAAKAMDKLTANAEEIARKEADEGKIKTKDIATRSAQILEATVDQTISKIQQPKSPALQKGDATKSESGDKKQTADEYYKFLKDKYPNRQDKAIRARVKEKFPDSTVESKKENSMRGEIDRSKPKDIALSRREGYKRRKEEEKRKQQAVA